MYFGGSIMTFALPLGAFIVISVALFYLFRAGHSGPKLKNRTTGSFAAIGTREPGPAPVPAVASAETATPEETAASESAEGKAGEE
jgi:hypothetical protein